MRHAWIDTLGATVDCYHFGHFCNATLPVSFGIPLLWGPNSQIFSQKLYQPERTTTNVQRCPPLPYCLLSNFLYLNIQYTNIIHASRLRYHLILFLSLLSKLHVLLPHRGCLWGMIFAPLLTLILKVVAILGHYSQCIPVSKCQFTLLILWITDTAVFWTVFS